MTPLCLLWVWISPWDVTTPPPCTNSKIFKVFQRYFSYLTQKINSSTYYKSGNCCTKNSKQGDGTNILKEVTLFERAEMREMIRKAGPVGEGADPQPGPPHMLDSVWGTPSPTACKLENLGVFLHCAPNTEPRPVDFSFPMSLTSPYFSLSPSPAPLPKPPPSLLRTTAMASNKSQPFLAPWLPLFKGFQNDLCKSQISLCCLHSDSTSPQNTAKTQPKPG